MVYLGLSLFVLLCLMILRFPFAQFMEGFSYFFLRSMVGVVCLYALHLTASYSGWEWHVPINVFTTGFAILCGFPGVVGILVLSILN